MISRAESDQSRGQRGVPPGDSLRTLREQLRGLRVCIVAAPTVHFDSHVAAWLAAKLRARGAAVLVELVRPGVQLEPLRDRVLRFAPTAVVSAWSDVALELCRGVDLPVIHLGSARATPAVVLDEAAAGIVLWLDPPGVAAPLDCRLPACAIGVLSRATRDAAGDEVPNAIAAVLVGTREAVRAAQPLGPRPSLAMAIGRADFIDYLHTSSPAGLHSRADVEAYLDQAIALGMPAWDLDVQPIFDRARSWNWLFQRSAAFRCELGPHRRAREMLGDTPEARGHRGCCSSRRAGERRLAAPRRVQLGVSLSIDASDLDPGTRVRINLPYPVRGETQPEISLIGVDERLRASFAPELGWFYGAEVVVPQSQRIELSYRAEVATRELHVHPPDSLQSAVPGESFAPVERAARASGDAWQRAFLVYDWMMSAGRFRKTSPTCRCPGCAAAQFLLHRSGDCILLSHAFVGLCERVGVRARVARGALFDAPLDGTGRRFGVARPGEPTIGHTWAEFEAPCGGWVPVELDAVALSDLGPALVWDGALRERLERDRRWLRRTGFGTLSAARVRFSRSVLTVPYALHRDDAQPRGQRWTPVPIARLRFAHEVELLGGC